MLFPFKFQNCLFSIYYILWKYKRVIVGRGTIPSKTGKCQVQLFSRRKNQEGSLSLVLKFVVWVKTFIWFQICRITCSYFSINVRDSIDCLRVHEFNQFFLIKINIFFETMVYWKCFVEEISTHPQIGQRLYNKKWNIYKINSGSKIRNYMLWQGETI